MYRRIVRLFQIKTRFDAFAVTYALAVGAVARGEDYIAQYPGFPGYLLAGVCTIAVFMAGGKLVDSVKQPVDDGVRRSSASHAVRSAATSSASSAWLRGACTDPSRMPRRWADQYDRDSA